VLESKLKVKDHVAEAVVWLQHLLCCCRCVFGHATGQSPASGFTLGFQSVGWQIAQQTTESLHVCCTSG
jgi:hypothetical protein